jgi:hypothetical protein
MPLHFPKKKKKIKLWISLSSWSSSDKRKSKFEKGRQDFDFWAYELRSAQRSNQKEMACGVWARRKNPAKSSKNGSGVAGWQGRFKRRERKKSGCYGVCWVSQRPNTEALFPILPYNTQTFGSGFFALRIAFPISQTRKTKPKLQNESSRLIREKDPNESSRDREKTKARTPK